MKNRRGKNQVVRILIKNNWNYTRKAVMLLDVIFVLLFALGIVCGNEFLTKPKVLLCMTLFLLTGTVFVLGMYYIRRYRRRLMTLPLYLLFWAVYEVLFVGAASEAASFFALFLMSIVLAVSMAVFPTFSYFSAALFYTGQIFAFVGMAAFKGYGSEYLVYLTIPQICCAIFALYRHNLEEKHIKDRLLVENFIEESGTDALTGLLNIRGLARKLEASWSCLQRESSEVSVLMMDIDYFKLYNDTFGHPQGDVCIKQIGGAILNNVRKHIDFAARVGGEEFLIFMPGMDEAAAVEWAAGLRRDIALMGIRHSDNAPFTNVTVSMGVMSCEAVGDLSFEDMKRQADEWLYMAKNNGRDCICANGRIYVEQHSMQSFERLVI